jgi:hypothetical protein
LRSVIDVFYFSADTAARKLIKLMLPRGKVSANHALKIIASLSGRRISERIQVGCLSLPASLLAFH